jgi:phospholipid/cholesterol/gamma-HCH transport system permease protein
MRPEAIGRAALALVGNGVRWFKVTIEGIGQLRALRRAPARLVFLRQIYFTGVEALTAVGLIAVLSGIVVITEVASLVGQETKIVARVALWTIVRELGPVLTAVVVIARSSSAAASELASMNVRGELDSLRAMGISPAAYLVAPRLAGITLAVVALTFYFQFIAILVGYLFTGYAQGTPLVTALGNVVSLLTLTEVGVSVTKSFVFGLVIASTSCYFGLSARGGVTAVPRAATGAVVRNLLAVFFLDGLITYVAFF